LGLLYSLAICRDKLASLDALERIIDIQAKRQVRELLEDIVKQYNEFLNKLRAQAGEINRKSGLIQLRGSAHSRVGTEHARYIWIFAVSSENVELLKRIIEELKVLKKISDLTRFYDLETELIQDITLLLEGGEKYIDEARDQFKDLEQTISAGSFKEIKELLEGIVKLYIRSCDVESVHDLVEDIEKLWSVLALPNINEPALWMLISKNMKSYIEQKCTGVRVNVRDPIARLTHSLDKLLQRIEVMDYYQNSIRKLLSNVGIEIRTPTLEEFSRALKDSKESLSKIVNEIDALSVYDKLILYEYLNRLVTGRGRGRGRRRLLERLDSFERELSEIINKYVNLESLLREIVELGNKIVETAIPKASSAFREDLHQIITESQIFAGTSRIDQSKLGELIKNLEAYYAELKKFYEDYGEYFEKMLDIQVRLHEVREYYK
jgi:DNA polymerase III delta prime subunit